MGTGGLEGKRMPSDELKNSILPFSPPV